MIIGLIGNPRSGKDTVADFLVKSYNFNKIAFADQIKQEYFEKSGMTNEKYEELKKEGKCESVREKLWNYSKGRKYVKGQDYFINIVLDKLCQEDNWVITDIRTDLELDRLLTKGATVIVIRNSESDENIRDSQLSTHRVNSFDSIVNDYETVELLEENLEDFFRRKIMESEEPYKPNNT